MEEAANEAQMLVQTVQGNYEGYTKREVLKPNKVHHAQAMLGNPSKKDYNEMVSNNLIANCPIFPTDVSNAQAILGQDLASIQGKTIWRTPAPVVADYMAVPCSLVDANQVMMLAAYVFFVSGTAFLLTVPQRIKFVCCELYQGTLDVCTVNKVRKCHCTCNTVVCVYIAIETQQRLFC
jgi:hypothetical protein